MNQSSTLSFNELGQVGPGAMRGMHYALSIGVATTRLQGTCRDNGRLSEGIP
jgi:hypothetical protein